MMNTEDRFWSKVRKPNVNGCWIWMGSTLPHGYGTLSEKGKTVYAHRRAYELLVGQIPDGMHIDHLCRSRNCCNPSHMEPVTQRENTLRGVNPAAANAKKTVCAHGHLFDEKNTYQWKAERRCRACGRAFAARKRKENRR